MRVLVIAIWIIMVTVTGYTLFHISFQVEALDGQLAELNQQIRDEQETIHNLKAEWSYSSRPDWIESLGKEFLPDMHSMEPSQVMAIEDIPFRRTDPQEADAGAEAASAAPSGTTEVLPATLVRTSQ
ncbi:MULTISPECIES: cell division protein FtsL [unclassified Hwanghaeella]|jgi:hypothetical protein|uniref:cell division protein FtsL n=1 Tax=unclassified Hwanghaeella TaxID=2605944 RepID=UPI000C950241|nr:hypothetical protein [Rhodospirillales bacterium]|tara:strand:- start:134 stop:514 length:381 start_codon:yes stop_codon:yes gene_type:complete